MGNLWCNNGFAQLSTGGRFRYFFVSKYSEQINRTRAAKEMFFFSASCLSALYSSDGILIFSALSFNLSPPNDYNNTTIIVARQEVFKKFSFSLAEFVEKHYNMNKL